MLLSTRNQYRRLFQMQTTARMFAPPKCRQHPSRSKYSASPSISDAIENEMSDAEDDSPKTDLSTKLKQVHDELTQSRQEMAVQTQGTNKQAMQEVARTMWEEEIAEEDCEAYLLKFMESGEPIERQACRSQRTFECPGTHSEPSLTQCLPPSQCR